MVAVIDRAKMERWILDNRDGRDRWICWIPDPDLPDCDLFFGTDYHGKPWGAPKRWVEAGGYMRLPDAPRVLHDSGCSLEEGCSCERRALQTVIAKFKKELGNKHNVDLILL